MTNYSAKSIIVAGISVFLLASCKKDVPALKAADAKFTSFRTVAPGTSPTGIIIIRDTLKTK